jgi:iron complex outermembrane recepter protein
MGKPAQAERSMRIRAWLMGSAALSLLAATQAAAQDVPAPAEAPAEEEEVLVTGIRETMRTSIDVKKRETAIVDALSTDEIGDLPALSVGEAIQTITGATTHREKGGASEIALRGLGPFLSNATFNGRDATNGSGDRSVNFNQFPSELINNIKIYKTQQADLVEGGVAGTIDIGTLRPLDSGKMRVQGEIKANYSPYQDKVVGSSAWGWRGTLSYVDQYELGGLGELGIAIGVQRNSTNNPEETVAGSSTWTACNATKPVANNANCTAIDRTKDAAGTPFYLAPNSMAWRQISETDERDAVFGAIQWKFSDRVELNIDAQYSDRTFVENRRDLNISEMRNSLTNVIYDENGVIQKMNGRSAVESTASNLARSEEYLGGGANLRWDATDRLTLALDGSYSRTIRTEIERQVRLRTDALDMNGVRQPINHMRIPYTYEVKPGNYAPTITFDPRFDPNNHALFWDDVRPRRDENERRNEIWGVRLDADYKLDGFISNIAVGGRWAQQTYRDFDVRNEITLTPTDPPAGREDARVNLLCRTQFPQTGFLEQARGNSITSWATFDPLCLMREYTGSEDPGRPAEMRSSANRDVTERTMAGYIMAEYGGDLGAMPVRGNFGVRVVNTKVTSIGLRTAFDVVSRPDGTITLQPSVPSNFDTVTLASETTRFLPSVNAIFELQPNRLLLRAAAYRAMSRPAPSALGAGRDFFLSDSTTADTIEEAIREIRANGSPALKPLMSWNGDLALEYYPNRDSLFSATLYFKEFSGGFMLVQNDEQFTIGGQQVTVPVIQTANSPDKSQLWGVEITLANRFSWLPKPLDGFGGKISYNYADTNFENEDLLLGESFSPATGVTTPGIIPPAGLSGFSKHVVSAQLYYQLGGFSIQGIYNYRSNYYQDFVGGNSQLRYVRGNETFDLRASYDISSNVSLRFEATNILDSPKITDMPVEGSIRQYHYYGPRYFIGARFRL